MQLLPSYIIGRQVVKLTEQEESYGAVFRRFSSKNIFKIENSLPGSGVTLALMGSPDIPVILSGGAAYTRTGASYTTRPISEMESMGSQGSTDMNILERILDAIQTQNEIAVEQYLQIKTLKDELSSTLQNIYKELRSANQVEDDIGLRTTIGGHIYEELRKQIEEKYPDKIVAIDLENKTVVGVGNSVEEAYKEALKNSPKKRFYFRHVGKNYLARV